MYEDWLSTVIDQALRNRNTKADDESKGEFVVVSNEFFNDLKNSQYLSSK